MQEGETAVQVFVRESRDTLKKLNGVSYEGSLLLDDDPWPATWRIESREIRIWTTYSERRGIRIRYRCRDGNDRLREVKQWLFPESENDWERRKFRILHRNAYKGPNPNIPETNEDALAASNDGSILRRSSWILKGKENSREMCSSRKSNSEQSG